MPGYIVHLAVASELVRQENIKESAYIEEFFVGSIIADAYGRTEKMESHFWDAETCKNLNRMPNIEGFLKKYGHRLKEPFIRGYWGHLYLDYIFVNEYWENHFSLLDSNYKPEKAYDLVDYIEVKDKGIIYRREDFLSDRLYYGDYDKIFSHIQKKYNIILPDIEKHILTTSYDYRNAMDEINYDVIKPQLEIMMENIRKSVNKERKDKEELAVFDIEELYRLIDRTVEILIKTGNKKQTEN